MSNVNLYRTTADAMGAATRFGSAVLATGLFVATLVTMVSVVYLWDSVLPVLFDV